MLCFFLRAISEKEILKIKGKKIHVGNSGIFGVEIGNWVGVVMRVGLGVRVVGVGVEAGFENDVGEGDDGGVAEGDGITVGLGEGSGLVLAMT